jgi:RimJ/RimL family protein N-acetyltransferase
MTSTPRYLVLVREAIDAPPEPQLAHGLTVRFWRPTTARPLSPGASVFRSVAWSAYHALHIFRNRELGAVLIQDGDKVVSQLVVFPPYYAFPYMREDDVQIGYVATDPQYRGRGLARTTTSLALRRWSKPGRRIFYIADEANVASLNVAMPLGFSKFGVASHRNVPFLPRGLGRYQLVTGEI